MISDEEVEAERERLLGLARGDRPPAGLTERTMRRAEERGSRSRLGAAVAGGFVFAAAAGALLWFKVGPSENATIVTPEPAPVADSAMMAPVEPPSARCEEPYVAQGDALLFDDFEDADRGVLPDDGRMGPWIYLTDKDPLDSAPFLVPEKLPEELRRGESRSAAHLKGDVHREWGASMEFLFEPHGCYDASAYGGMRFSARGPGRFHFQVREIDNIPVEHGGLCEENCWRSHVKVIDATDDWQTYEVRWEDVRRRGYDSGPLDLERVHSVQFLVQPEDTPFDLWIDDVEFLPRD